MPEEIEKLPKYIYALFDCVVDKYYFIGRTKHPSYAIYVNERDSEPIRVYVGHGIPDKFFTDEKKALERLLECAKMHLDHVEAHIKRKSE